MRRIVTAPSILFAVATINGAGLALCFAQAPAQIQTHAVGSRITTEWPAGSPRQLAVGAQQAPQSTGNSRSAGRKPAVADLRPAAPASSYGIGSSGVIRPSASFSVYPFAFSPIFGYRSPNLGFPQPLGHQIISNGPNGYIYRPVTDLGALVDQALAALRAADYETVLVQLDPVLQETPDDGTAWLVRAQALFGLASYAKAAQSLHTALRLLPPDRWGRPVTNRSEYFRSSEEYTARLRTLEAYVRAHPSEGAGHFLLGYHYGYLGHGSEAVRELRTALRLVIGDDDLAAALLDNVGPAPDEKPRPGLHEDDAPIARGPREF